MSIKDFFRLILKLFALYTLVTSLTVLPSLIGYIQYDFEWIGIAWMILAIGIMVVLFIWLLFKPELIIDKLKLEQGFEGDRIPFERLDGLAILKLGSIIVGGLLFLRQIPPFFTDSYMLLKSSVKETTVDYLFGVNPIQTKIDFAANILNLLIGYLLVTNYDKVGRLLLPKKED